MNHVPHNRVPKPEYIQSVIPDDRRESLITPGYIRMESDTKRNTDQHPFNAVFDKIAVPLPGLLTFKKPIGWFQEAKTVFPCACDVSNHDPYIFPRIG